MQLVLDKSTIHYEKQVESTILIQVIYNENTGEIYNQKICSPPPKDKVCFENVN